MQPSEGAQVDLGKAQVIDRVPKVIKELKFGVMYVRCPCSLCLNFPVPDSSLMFVRLIQVQ